MKNKKKLKRTELVDETLHLAQSRFKPSIPLIAECIKLLVSKEYMEHEPSTDELTYI